MREPIPLLSSRRALLASVHISKKQLGEDGLYRLLLHALTDRWTAADLDDTQLRMFSEILKIGPPREK